MKFLILLLLIFLVLSMALISCRLSEKSKLGANPPLLFDNDQQNLLNSYFQRLKEYPNYDRDSLSISQLGWKYYQTIPELDNLKRPLSIYGKTVHERCSRLRYFRRRRFARAFDDYGAKKGWCLFKLGCKGPVSHNACAAFKWNQGTSFPIDSGHPCLGCSEPGFWDKGSFYSQLRRRRGRRLRRL